MDIASNSMFKINKYTFLLLIFQFVPARKCFAHDNMEYVLEAAKINSQEAPKIDGKFDYPVWKKGKVITNFIQRDPVPGARVTE